MQPTKAPVLLLLTAVLSGCPTLAQDGRSTATLDLRHLSSKDAATLVRTVVGTRDVEMVDDDTLRVTDSAATRRLAETVLEMVEPREDRAPTVATHRAPDGTVLAVVPLREATSRDAMAALQPLRIARTVWLTEPRVVAVRDGEEAVAEALRVLDELEAADRERR